MGLVELALVVAQASSSGWQCEQDHRGLWVCAGAVVHAPAPEPAPVREIVPEPEPEPPIQPEPAAPDALPLQGYVLQVGAYRSQGEESRAAAAIGSDRITVLPTERDDGTWYVLLLGAFSDYGSAERAGRRYKDDSGGSFWVRSMSDVMRSLPSNQPPIEVLPGVLPE